MSPRYRIQEVAALTGVPATTLRAWERRYGVPRPARSPAGHRSYGPREVAEARRMDDMVRAGVAASEAARRVIAAGQAAPPPLERDPYAVLLERILSAIEDFDPERLETEVRRAMLLGSSVDAYERVMRPVLRALGERWRSSSEAVAQEHLTTEILRCVAQDLHRLIQPAHPVGRAVLACFADELHVLPLYGVAFRLAQRGFRTRLLGPRTPPAVVGVARARLKPDLIALSVTVSPTEDHAEALVGAYGAACGAVPWVVGGAGAADLRALVEAAGGAVPDAPGLDALADRLAGRAPVR